MTELVIREMTPQDLGLAAEREACCLGHEAWTAALLDEAVGCADTVYLVAEADGGTVGHAGIRNVCGVGEVTNVCVDAAHRGRGVGGALLRALLERGSALGIRDCTLEVRAGNAAAIRLYERCGFRSEGVRPGFYREPKDDAVIYWLRRKSDL